MRIFGAIIVMIAVYIGLEYLLQHVTDFNLQWFSLFVGGVSCGMVARRHAWLVALLGVLIIDSALITMLVAIGKSATREYYDFSTYFKEFAPFVLVGLITSVAGSVIGQIISLRLLCARGTDDHGNGAAQ